MNGAVVQKILETVEIPSLPQERGAVVWGDGPVPADICIVGEAPGEEESKLGRAFVGKAGRLLNEKLQLVGLSRPSIYITNVVKKRPVDSLGGIASPKKDEIAAWLPVLRAELALVKPKYVLCLGNVANKAVTKSTNTISKDRGIVRKLPSGKICLSTYHPAAILRRREMEPVMENDFWKFSKLVKGELTKELPKKHKVVVSVEQLRELKDKLLTAEEFSFDLETKSFDWMRDPILTIAFSSTPGEAYVVPLLGKDCVEIWPQQDKSVVTAILKEIFESPVPKGGQHIRFDVRFLRHNGYVVNNLAFDTLVEHHLIDENLPHNLDFLASHELGESGYDEELKASLPKVRPTFDQAPEKVLWKYTCHDVDYTHTLHTLKFAPRLRKDNPKLWSYYNQWLVPLESTLIDMEIHGMVIDPEWMSAVREDYIRQIQKLDGEIALEVGRDINPNSTKQLQKLFFGGENPRHTSTKKTKSGADSVDEETLQFLAETDTLANKILTRRRHVKLISTYIDGLLENLGTDDKIHTDFLLTGTVTGRLSSRNPNMQNIPDDPLIRGMFVAPKGHVVIGADYKQMEVVVLAALAEELRIVEMYEAGVDLYKGIASLVFGMNVDDVVDKHRKVMKVIVLGLNYGRGPWAMAKDLQLKVHDAENLVGKYFHIFPKIYEYQQSIKKFARERGYVEGIFGRRRHLNFDRIKDDPKVVAEYERQAINMPTQNAAAEITNIALVRLHRAFVSGQTTARPVNNLHDALYFCSPEETWRDDVKKIRALMEQHVPELGFTPRVSMVVGYRWGDDSLLSEK